MTLKNASLLLCLLIINQNGFAAALQERAWFENEAVFGGQIYLRTVGDPEHPPVVLVHGLGDKASTSWEDLLQRLKHDYFVFTFDLPGFGRSSKQNALYSPVNYARLIHQLTQRILNKPFHLVGHSMGGAISLQYAYDYPASVKTLTLIDAAGILHRLAYTKYLAPLGIDHFFHSYNVFEDKKITDLAGVLLSTLEKKTPIDMNLLISLEPFRAKILQGDPNAIAGLALVLNDFSRIPETIRQPTLIVWGEHDRVTPLRTGYVLESLIPNAELKLIPSAGHIAFLEKPGRFFDMLIPHLEQSKKPRQQLSFKPTDTEFRPTAQCYNQSAQVFTGRIGSLLIEGCQDILVHNAEINNLVIINSAVTLRHFRIISPLTALRVHHSNLNITAGHIEGDIAIETHHSHLDIAGTHLVGGQAAVKAPEYSTIVFSLGRIDSPLYHDLVIHGMKEVSPETHL
jgi:pimeloyl-ACP methyl ester carboxylesterase